MRQIHMHKSVVAKQKVERGIEHTTKKKIIPAKAYYPQFTCKCVNKKKQKTNKHELCTLFIRGHVKRQPVKTKRSALFPIVALKKRDFNLVYSLTDYQGLPRVFFEMPPN